MTGDAPRGTVRTGFTEVIGATPSGCIRLLEIRPLLFGTAWKVLDLLLEAAFAAAGEQADQRRTGRWTIKQKANLAKAAIGRPPSIAAELWRALTLACANTVGVRHSLRACQSSTRAFSGHRV
jgi:hypothetical protein